MGHYIVDGLAQRLGAGKLKPHPALKKDGGHLATAKHEGASLLLYKTGASTARPHAPCVPSLNPSTPQTRSHARTKRAHHLMKRLAEKLFRLRFRRFKDAHTSRARLLKSKFSATPEGLKVL